MLIIGLALISSTFNRRIWEAERILKLVRKPPPGPCGIEVLWRKPPQSG